MVDDVKVGALRGASAALAPRAQRPSRPTIFYSLSLLNGSTASLRLRIRLSVKIHCAGADIALQPRSSRTAVGADAARSPDLGDAVLSCARSASSPDALMKFRCDIALHQCFLRARSVEIIMRSMLSIIALRAQSAYCVILNEGLMAEHARRLSSICGRTRIGA